MEHKKENCGECAACLFEKELEKFQNMPPYRILKTKDKEPTSIEFAFNDLDKQGYDLVAVDHGMAIFRARPPQLPSNFQPIILRKSDLEKAAASGEGFGDDDIGEPFK